METNNTPIGFGLAMSSNTAAMNRYSHLSQAQRQQILDKAHCAHSREDMYALVAHLANGTTK